MFVNTILVLGILSVLQFGYSKLQNLTPAFPQTHTYEVLWLKKKKVTIHYYSKVYHPLPIILSGRSTASANLNMQDACRKPQQRGAQTAGSKSKHSRIIQSAESN